MKYVKVPVIRVTPSMSPIITLKENFRKTWEETMMQIAFDLSNKNHCMVYRVGAVIAHMNHGEETIVKMGYNGPVRGAPHCDDPSVGCSKEACGFCVGSHAEMNAIGNVAGSSESMKGATLFVTMSPCESCAKQITNSNLKDVIYLYNYGEVAGFALKDEDKKRKKLAEAQRAIELIHSRKPIRKFQGRLLAIDQESGSYVWYRF